MEKVVAMEDVVVDTSMEAVVDMGEAVVEDCGGGCGGFRGGGCRGSGCRYGGGRCEGGNNGYGGGYWRGGDVLDTVKVKYVRGWGYIGGEGGRYEGNCDVGVWQLNLGLRHDWFQ